MKSKSIFIVDDDPLHQFVSRLHLNKLGYKNVSCFGSGEQCIDNLHLSPDIIFLDYMMEAMNGLDALKVIKGRHRDCFVVFVSGQDNREEAFNAIKCGALDYIVKGTNQLKQIESALSSIQLIFEKFKQSSQDQQRSFLTQNRWYNGFLSNVFKIT